MVQAAANAENPKHVRLLQDGADADAGKAVEFTAVPGSPEAALKKAIEMYRSIASRRITDPKYFPSNNTICKVFGLDPKGNVLTELMKKLKLSGNELDPEKIMQEFQNEYEMRADIGEGVTLFGVTITSSLDDNAIQQVAQECISKVGSLPKGESAQTLAKVPPRLLAKILEAVYDNAPGEAGSAQKAGIMVMLIRDFKQVTKAEQRVFVAAMQQFEMDHPETFKEFFNTFNATYKTMFEDMRQLSRDISSIKKAIKEVAFFSGLTAGAQVVNKDKVAHVKTQFLKEIDRLEQYGESLAERAYRANPADQKVIQAEYNKFMKAMAKLRTEVDEAFAPLLETKDAAQAQKARQEVKDSVDAVVVRQAIKVHKRNRNVLETGRDTIAEGKTLQSYPLVLDKESVGIVQKATDRLAGSSDTMMKDLAIAGRVAMADYFSDLKAFNIMALQAAWQFKDPIAAQKGMEYMAEMGSAYYAKFTERMVEYWDTIAEKAKSTVQKVLKENQQYLTWLEKIWGEKKAERKAADHDKQEQIKADLQVAKIELAKASDDPVKRSNHEILKEELADRIVAADSMKDKNIS